MRPTWCTHTTTVAAGDSGFNTQQGFTHMEMVVVHNRKTNIHNIEVWEDDHLRKLDYRVREYLGKGWAIVGHPELENEYFDTCSLAVQALRMMMGTESTNG